MVSSAEQFSGLCFHRNVSIACRNSKATAYWPVWSMTGANLSTYPWRSWKRWPNSSSNGVACPLPTSRNPATNSSDCKQKKSPCDKEILSGLTVFSSSFELIKKNSCFACFLYVLLTVVTRHCQITLNITTKKNRKEKWKDWRVRLLRSRTNEHTDCLLFHLQSSLPS